MYNENDENRFVENQDRAQQEQETRFILPQQYPVTLRFIVVRVGPLYLDRAAYHIRILNIVNICGHLGIAGRRTCKSQPTLARRILVDLAVGGQFPQFPTLRQPGDTPVGGQGVRLCAARAGEGPGHEHAAQEKDQAEATQHD